MKNPCSKRSFRLQAKAVNGSRAQLIRIHLRFFPTMIPFISVRVVGHTAVSETDCAQGSNQQRCIYIVGTPQDHTAQCKSFFLTLSIQKSFQDVSTGPHTNQRSTLNIRTCFSLWVRPRTSQNVTRRLPLKISLSPNFRIDSQTNTGC